jgi:hypothetical protein
MEWGRSQIWKIKRLTIRSIHLRETYAKVGREVYKLIFSVPSSARMHFCWLVYLQFSFPKRAEVARETLAAKFPESVNGNSTD